MPSRKPNNDLGAAFKRWSRQRLPQLDGRLYLPQLQDRVTIHRDAWGIPHIYAHSRHDLLQAQGFVHAQDRLWQMELNRRAAKGTLSAVFGKLTLEADRLSRTFGFARLAHGTLSQIAPQAHADLTAYTTGVNAFLAGSTPLPIEFVIVQHKPRPWQLLDSIAYAHLQMWALTHGAIGELVKAQILQQADPKIANDLLMHYPESHPATLPNGIEENAQWIDAWRGTAVPWTNPFHGKGNLDGAGRGSNAWVIAPERSRSGGAILCNDMHLPIGAPSIWHYQHLHSEDGLQATGFTQPGLPYVMVGHNGRIAWGATLAYTDCEDLFIEQLHPDDPNLYQFGDEWRQAKQVEEQIEVRFQKPHAETVTITHHGPLIHNLLQGNTPPLAFNSTALRSGLTIDGFGWLNAAENWDEFVTAVQRIHAPSLNLLYADRQGNIGHWVSGRVPIRAAGDGTVPAPGWDGCHEWVATIPFDQMPHALNPQSGLIISANHQILPPDKSTHNLGQMWRNGYRAERLRQLLHTQTNLSVADCRRIQLDTVSLPGLQLIGLLKGLPLTQPDAQIAYKLLAQWDGDLCAESLGGAVFEQFVEQLTVELLESAVPEEMKLALLGQGIQENLHPVNEFQGYWLVNLLKILSDKCFVWFSGKVATRNSLLERCLAETTAVLRKKLGENPADWQWGKLHRVSFQHALGRAAPFNHIFNVGSLPLGGDGNTVAQAGMRPGSLVSDGVLVSSRFIIDMSRVETAEAILAPGQSGHLGSPHYDDLASQWQQGGYFPVLWRIEDVLEAAKHTLVLLKRPRYTIADE